jgi:dynein heavy chain
MKQEVCRAHKSEKWSLNDMIYVSEVTAFSSPEQIKSSPDEGIYIQGLMLEGAGFDRRQNCLVESEPKILHSPLPVLHITAMSRVKAAAKKRSMGPLYESPLYKYGERTDKYLLCIVDLPCGEKNPNHWLLRGTALLCSS